jgi:hypothetical protein
MVLSGDLGFPFTFPFVRCFVSSSGFISQAACERFPDIFSLKIVRASSCFLVRFLGGW